MGLKKALKSIGLYFGPKQKPNAPDRIEQIMQSVIKHLPQIRELLREERRALNAEFSDGEKLGQMYDFYRNAEETLNGTMAWDEQGQPAERKDERIIITPVLALKELEVVPTPFDCENLDEKIASLKDKSKLVNQRFVGAQLNGLIKRLENRKRYHEEYEFYHSFPNTTEEKIDDLLSKYKLVMQTSDLFIPVFPPEAIAIMKQYTAVTKKITGETPVYYVIAEEKDFEKKREKLDPILLVQSPFGFFFQVLGAYGKEMLLLSEL